MRKLIFIITILLIVFISSILIYINISFNSNIPVLAYHAVIENPINDTDISIKNFEKQMKYLSKNNYKTLSLDEFYAWKKGKKINGKKVVLTFDDGDESFYTNVLPILEKYNFKAAVFIIGANTDNNNSYMDSIQINDLITNHKDIDVESHSYNLHIMDLAYSNNYDIYNDDMKLYQDKDYKYYAYPFGVSNPSYINALKDNKYKLAFLYSPSKWSNKDQNDYMITRVPIYKSNSLTKFKLKILLRI